MGLGDRRQQTYAVAHDEDLQDMRSAHRRGPPRGVAVGRDVFAAVLGPENARESQRRASRAYKRRRRQRARRE